jgi:glycosyltransferase involved in cell wall biosynthesis
MTRWAMRNFHKKSQSVYTYTPTMKQKLIDMGVKPPVVVWPGGVDTNLFRPYPKPERQRKVAMYIGRVATEKNLEAFLECRGNYDKVVVGDGRARVKLEQQYPDTQFLGPRFGEELAKTYASADVFVFPSRTDTFGLVILEALACGVPVAGYPVQGPVDILNHPGVGCMSENLSEAIEGALAHGNPEQCRQLALEYRWERQAERFLDNLTFFD